MKILFITHVSNMAGANRSMFQLIKELKDGYGVEPVVLVPEADGNVGGIHSALRAINIPIIETQIWFFKRNHPTFRNLLGYIRYLWRSRHLPEMLRSYHFDLIHSNSSVIDIGGYLSRTLHVKHIWHLREFGDLDYNLKPIGGKLYERYTYRHADAFIAISNIISDYYKDKVPKEKIHTIYNGVYLPDNAMKATHCNPVIQFLCAGVICEAKNQKEIVLAADELVNHRKVNAPFHINLVGIQAQPYTNELISLITEKGLQSYVDILPEVDGIQSLAATMDVGIVSSKAEAFGRVTIEYQLQNLLVIANDSGANPELIEEGVTGLLYPTGDYCAIAKKMKWVLEHYKEIHTISKSGMQHAQKYFLSEYNTQHIYNLYKTIHH